MLMLRELHLRHERLPPSYFFLVAQRGGAAIQNSRFQIQKKIIAKQQHSMS